MKGYPTIFLILLSFSCLISMAEAQGQVSTPNPSLESKLDQLMTGVYCYCGCVRETIKQCVCGVAQQIETDFRNRLAAGETVQGVRDDYLGKHGTQYSAVMPAKGFNIVAYAMPAIILVLLGGIVCAVLKSKRSGARANSSVPTAGQEPGSGDPYQHIEAELERYKQRR